MGTGSPPPRDGGALDWWLRDRTADGTDREGRWVLGQPPNAAIWVFVAATLLRLSPLDALDAELRGIAHGALLVWGLDELLRGHNPMRRMLGGLVLTWQLAWLLR